MFKIILGTIALILLALQFGCAVKAGPIYHKGGREYGRIKGIWGSTFWNYYERGLSYAEGEFWTEAIHDFQQAIRLKNQDQRRVRTYGLHILDDYFPHREMGIVYYAMGDYQKAIQELSLSLKYYPSAKAKYYLNRSRQAYLQQRGQDKACPQILFTSHRDQQLVSGFEALIEGRASDDCFVEKIMINGIPYLCELAQPEIPFSATVDLEPGVNEIKVVAKDLLGKETVASLHLIADRQAPLLYVEDLRIMPAAGNDGRYPGGEIQIEGQIKDVAGVRSFQIDQKEVPLHGAEGRFLFRSPLIESRSFLPFTAEDRLGNRVEGQIGIETDQQKEYTFLPRLVRVASLRLAGVGSFSQQGESRDLQPPTIRIDSPKGDLVVDWESVFVCGEVQDTGGIRDILINHESVMAGEGKRIYFNHILKLPQGKTTITIQAIDRAGNEKTKSITIERKINPVRQIGARMSLAIIPFTQYGKNEPGGGNLVTDFLIKAFADQERFFVVDRQRIDQVLRRLKKDDPENPEISPREFGTMVCAETILAGHVYESKGFVEIAARLIDTETSVILDCQDVYGPEDSESLKTLLEGLALKFKHSFPLVEGMIVEKEGQSIFVNLGKEKNIKEFTKFIVFRDGRPLIDPLTKKVLEYRPDILGEAKIVKVFEQTSQADLRIKDQQKDTVRVKDRVITK